MSLNELLKIRVQTRREYEQTEGSYYLTTTRSNLGHFEGKLEGIHGMLHQYRGELLNLVRCSLD